MYQDVMMGLVCPILVPIKILILHISGYQNEPETQFLPLPIFSQMQIYKENDPEKIVQIS